MVSGGDGPISGDESSGFSNAGDGGGQAQPTRPKVLIVDDEDYLHRAIVRTLQQPLGLRREDFLTALNVAAGITTFDANFGGIGAILSDMMMPGAPGIDLYRHVRKTHPALPFAFWSGFMLPDYKDELAHILATDSQTIFMEKPFDSNALLAWFQSALLIHKL